MYTRMLMVPGIALALGQPCPAAAAENAELQQIRNEIRQIKENYEARIQALEARLRQAENATSEQTASAAAMPQPVSASGTNAFNPGITLILSGTYRNLSQDPANYRLTGFIPGGEVGPGERGFSLAESELGIAANIDPDFYGSLTLAMAPDDTVAVEEAFIQSIGLSQGFTLKAGRFYSGMGYLNEQHKHVWDFADAPLAYQAFLSGQLRDDGVQLKWLAPAELFIELGAEIGRGANFLGSGRDKNGAGSAGLFAHLGGDAGSSASWRAGLSYLATSPRNRSHVDIDQTGTEVSNAFSGNSRLWLADFVWKWAPEGDAANTSFKLQGEYFQRREDGEMTYDTAGSAAADAYRARQSGWYVQGVYQFMPRWRVGLRFDRLHAGSIDYASNNAYLVRPDYNPSRTSLMFDYQPSEYSRFRLQVAQDISRQDVTDNQLLLQYQMSLGAHGAHKF